jgi:hypothetical protein
MDKTTTGYHPDFDVDLRVGELGEHLFGTFWEDLHRSGTVEVKVDRGAWKTGNHYVETAQSSDGVSWRASGINVTKATWWSVVSPENTGFICITVELLKALAASAPEAEQPLRNGKTNASKGRLVKMDDLWRAMMYGRLITE